MHNNLGKRLTTFWSDLAGGRLRNLDDLKAARKRLLVSNDAEGHSNERFLGTYEDPPGFQAPKRLMAPSHFTSEIELRQHDRADWQQVDPRLRAWSARFVESARRRGIPLFVHCAFRTPEEQRQLFLKGHSQIPSSRSAHCQGAAVDIVHGKFAWDMSNQEWAYLHKLGRETLARYNKTLPKTQWLNLTWGGVWSFYDPAHWEVTNWRDQMHDVEVHDPVRMTPRFILRNLS